MSYNVLVIKHGVYTRLMSYVKTMIKEVRFFLFTLGKSEISLGTFTSLALFDPLNDALHSPTFPPPNLSQWPLFASKKYAAVRNPSPLLENVLTICYSRCRLRRSVLST